jgi:hypothetical protein
MKPKNLAASIILMAIGLVGITSTTLRTNKPSREGGDKKYVLPFVEDMPKVANPLQF